MYMTILRSGPTLHDAIELFACILKIQNIELVYESGGIIYTRLPCSILQTLLQVKSPGQVSIHNTHAGRHPVSRGLAC